MYTLILIVSFERMDIIGESCSIGNGSSFELEILQEGGPF